MKPTNNKLKKIIKEELKQVCEQGEKKQSADVARASKKMTQAPGVEDTMQKISNKQELLGFLQNVLQGVSDKIKPNDVSYVLKTLAAQITKGG